MTGYNADRVRIIMDKVCRITKQQSPLCNDWEQLKYIDIVATEHWLDPNILIGVTYSESKIGITFAPTLDCSRMNNWWWLKGYKHDNGEVDVYALPYEWCWLYPFKDMYQFWDGIANTIRWWYVDKGVNSIEDLSRRYVWKPWLVKSSRSIRVKFYMEYK